MMKITNTDIIKHQNLLDTVEGKCNHYMDKDVNSSDLNSDVSDFFQATPQSGPQMIIKDTPLTDQRSRSKSSIETPHSSAKDDGFVFSQNDNNPIEKINKETLIDEQGE